MATTRADRVQRDLSDTPVTQENMIGMLGDELIPLLRDVRRALNRFIFAPQIPVLDHAPPVDADFGSAFAARPKDGVLSIGNNGKLYARINGVHTVIGP